MTGNFEKVPKAERYICLPSDIFENVFSKRDSQASTESHFVSIAKGGGMINAGIRDGELIGKIKHLYNVFLEQWDTECKPNGFEVHDIRLGGLICRIEHCKKYYPRLSQGQESRYFSVKRGYSARYERSRTG